MTILATVSCAHCRASVPLEFMPEPNTGYVCDPCAADYQAHVAANLARTFGDDAFRCEKCGMPVVGNPLGAKLCDPCEDEMHAEALALRDGEVTP
jgi:DNA-directed RNA polymerase subunit RPC12/RpoP